jgi:hypothetical protein
MDEKLCPLRKRAYKLGSGPGMPRSTSDEFLPCIREKCAWWVMVYAYPHGQTAPAVATGTGHCAALDWGKP